MASEAHDAGLVAQDAGDEPLSWHDAERRRRARLRIAAAVVVVVAVAAGVGALTLNAAAHYQRGRDALRAHRYGAAVEEFAAARVLTIWYRDAQALGVRAQQALELDAARAQVRRQQIAAVSRLLRTARDDVAAGDVAAAMVALREARVLVPSGTVAQTASQRNIVAELTSSLSGRGRQAIQAGRWADATQVSQAWLLLDPASTAAATLGGRAQTAQGLQLDLDAAKSAAAHHRWRDALRLARRVERQWSAFPGAAAVIARAVAALAPKPSPTASAPAAAPAPAPVVTSAPQPAAPPPP